VEAIRQGDIPGVQLRQRVQLARPTDELWLWLVDDARLERWAAARVERLGAGERRLLLADSDGGGCEHWRTVLEATGQRRVVRLERPHEAWRVATPLTFEIRPAADGAGLSVLQEGFHQLTLSSCLSVWEQYRRRWRVALARLAGCS